MASLIIDLVGGSSPWARGTQAGVGWKTMLTRFIPVGTGNTSAPVNVPSNKAVHPRGHGEHFSDIKKAANATGSSPWARGTRKTEPPALVIIRFIPVGTGNTARERAICVFNAVHPRGHGEHLTKRQATMSPCGSSPWARGTLQL